MSQHKAGSQQALAAFQGAELLRPKLRKLKEDLREFAQQQISFRKSNEKFALTPLRSELTELLCAAAEQLWNDKLTVEKAHFEEHGSELHYLCQRFETDLAEGLRDGVVQQKQIELNERRQAAGQITEVDSPGFFTWCCSRDFNHQQWWIQATHQLMPKFPVVRNGLMGMCYAPDFVLGDIVYVCAGQQAPADIRVMCTSDTVTVDVSHLTHVSQDVRVLAAEEDWLVDPLLKAKDKIQCQPSQDQIKKGKFDLDALLEERHLPMELRKSWQEEGAELSAKHARNILLKDAHVISGGLFGMVVRTALKPFIPASSYGGEESFEIIIDEYVPPSLSLSKSRGLFKSLCTRASLFCKGFESIVSIASTHSVVVTLTQELFTKGTVPAFCTLMTRLKRPVFLVNCDCTQEQLALLCTELRVQCIEFPTPEPAAVEKICAYEPPAKKASELPEPCALFVGTEHVTEIEEEMLTALLEQTQLFSDSTTVSVLNGISEVALYKLCVELGHPSRYALADKPLDKHVLYVWAAFQYSKCCLSLAEPPKQHRRDVSPMVKPALGIFEDSNVETSPLPSTIGSPTGELTFAAVVSGNGSSSQGYENSLASSVSCNLNRHYDNKVIESSEEMSVQQRNCAVIAGCRSDDPTDTVMETSPSPLPRKVSPVFISVDSIGVVSKHADGILLKTDLCKLGLALKIVDDAFA